MKVEEVIALFEENKNERGIAIWERMGETGLKTYGIGVTQLRGLAKKIGKDHELALSLYNQPILDAKMLSPMVDDPKKVTREQAEEQMSAPVNWMHSYAMVGSLFANLPFAKELALEWIISKNDYLRQGGYSLLYNLSKEDAKLPNEFFMPHLDVIEKHLQAEENFVKDAMNSALMGIGMRSSALNKRALEVAIKVGKVTVDYGDNSCLAPDCVKHLSNPRKFRFEK